MSKGPCAGCGRSFEDHPYRPGEAWDGTMALYNRHDDAPVYVIHYSDYCLESIRQDGPSTAYVEWRTKLAGRGEGRS